jgi:hypothetical protein
MTCDARDFASLQHLRTVGSAGISRTTNFTSLKMLTMPSASTRMASLPPQSASEDPVMASVSHLLSKAYSLPCSTAAQAFNQLVQPTSRFQLALDALLPRLDPKFPSEASSMFFCNIHHRLLTRRGRHPAGTTDFGLIYSILYVCPTSHWY